MPAGARRAGFLVLGNFRVIKRYNNADAYALSVGHLADRLRGGEAVPDRLAGARGRRSLSPSGQKLQQLLTARGFYSGDIDGNIGSGSREAIKNYQLAIGVRPDGVETRGCCSCWKPNGKLVAVALKASGRGRRAMKARIAMTAKPCAHCADHVRRRLSPGRERRRRRLLAVVASSDQTQASTTSGNRTAASSAACSARPAAGPALNAGPVQPVPVRARPVVYGDLRPAEQAVAARQEAAGRKPAQPSEPPLADGRSRSRRTPRPGRFWSSATLLAGGLAWGLDQDACRRAEARRRSTSRTTHPGWSATTSTTGTSQLPDILNSEKPDIVVGIFGGNDRQQMRIGSQRLADPLRHLGEDLCPARRRHRRHAQGLWPAVLLGQRAAGRRTPAMSATWPTSTASTSRASRRAAASSSTSGTASPTPDGQYIGWGPDIDGQVRQLRTSDGINFTRAGRLKLAFYVEREIRRKTGIGAGTVDLVPRPASRARSRSDRTARSGWSARSSRCRTRCPAASDTLAGAPEPLVYDPTTARSRPPPPPTPEPSVAAPTIVRTW